MKTLTLIALLSFVQFVAVADDVKFKEAMAKNIASLYAAQTPADFQNAINIFDRIGMAEKTKWQPFYYEAFGYILMSTKEANGAKKDALLDLAKEMLGKANEIKPNDSEIVALQGFEAMIRITVDPQTRGQEYSGVAIQYFKKALALNPENPRAVVLDGRMQDGMAKFFGGSSTEACDKARKALELLAKEDQTDVLAPHWGKQISEEMVNECK